MRTAVLVALLVGPALASAQPNLRRHIDVYEVEITYTSATIPGSLAVDRTPVHVYPLLPPFGFLPAAPPAVGTTWPVALQDRDGNIYRGVVTAVRYKNAILR